ncbi:MAG: hypothetical protein U5L96_00415 [Owenweeksia sp.]|nr:hypothetical protein [Owenweeksia sp.]
MKRSFLTIAFLGIIISQAQPSPEYSYGLHLRQLSVTPYDSIAVLDDMNPGSAPVRWAQYYFNDNYYVAAGQAYNGQQHLQYGYAQQGHKRTTYEIDANADTSRSLHYFRGSGVGDTAVKIYTHQNMSTPALRAHIQYFYNSSGNWILPTPGIIRPIPYGMPATPKITLQAIALIAH